MKVGAFVVDASVVVENLVRLRYWSEADLLFSQASEQDTDLWAPDLVYQESLAVLRKLVHRKIITSGDGGKAARWLARLPLVTTGTGAAVEEMWELRDVMSPYDAAYAVLAGRLRAPLVTSDERLAKSFRRKSGRAILLKDLPNHL